MFFINLSHIIPIFLCIIALQAAPVRGSLKVLSMYLFVVCLARTKNVPWHILAPAVVACDIFSIRRSAHPAGGFLYNRKCNFLLYKHQKRADICPFYNPSYSASSASSFTGACSRAFMLRLIFFSSALKSTTFASISCPI